MGCVVVLGMRATSRAGIGNVISKLQRVSFILWVWDMRILRTEKRGIRKFTFACEGTQRYNLLISGFVVTLRY